MAKTKQNSDEVKAAWMPDNDEVPDEVKEFRTIRTKAFPESHSIQESLSALIEVVKDIVQKQVHPDHNGEWLIETQAKLDLIQKSL
jgi:hypothetical protein